MESFSSCKSCSSRGLLQLSHHYASCFLLFPPGFFLVQSSYLVISSRLQMTTSWHFSFRIIRKKVIGSKPWMLSYQQLSKIFLRSQCRTLLTENDGTSLFTWQRFDFKIEKRNNVEFSVIWLPVLCRNPIIFISIVMIF